MERSLSINGRKGLSSVINKNILIICSDLESDSDANGICIKNIIRALPKGIKIYILSETLNNKRKNVYDNNVKIYFIPAPLLKRLRAKNTGLGRIAYHAFLAAHRVFGLVLYPDVSKIRSLKVRHIAKEIIKTENIGIVIGAYRPFESIHSLLYLKKEFNGITSIAYHLDLLLEPNTSNWIIKKYKNWKSNRVITKEFSELDAIILPESERHKYSESKTKIKFAGFPLYIKNEEGTCDFEFSNNTINIVYIGTLDSNNRNPERFLKSIETIIVNGKKVMLHLWGALADENIKIIISQYSCVVHHGMLENKSVYPVLKKSDLLLNVSNANTFNMVPSKIFQQFSTGKGIINLYYDERDKSLQYFTRYRHSLSLNNNNIDNNNHLLQKWIEENYGKTFTEDSDFTMFTPEYFVNIVDQINSECEHEKGVLI